jgi:hypothetical protein
LRFGFAECGPDQQFSLPIANNLDEFAFRRYNPPYIQPHIIELVYLVKNFDLVDEFNVDESRCLGEPLISEWV